MERRGPQREQKKNPPQSSPFTLRAYALKMRTQLP